jgi:hypothetical protein
MKILLPSLILLLFVSLASAITVEQIGKLAKLHTSDDVILQAIQKSKLDHPLTSKDIVYLKEQGVSDRVLSTLMEKKEEQKDQKEDAWRIYHTTDKKGKRVTVVTNLDEKGHRMGGEVPVEEYVPEQSQNESTMFPKEIHVTIENAPSERPVRDDYDQEEPPPQPGIPLYNFNYPSYYPMVPLYGDGSYQHFRHCCRGQIPGSFPDAFRGNGPGLNSGQPNWNYNAGYSTTPRVFHSQPQPAIPAGSAGYRKTR